MLMGVAPKDWDYTTNATPVEIREILSRTNATAIFGIGEKFGTIGAIIDGKSVEITTFRSEAYEPGSRHPSVSFGTDLIADLSRRDFTINAIAQDMFSGAIIDPFGGREDIERKTIVAVGSPDLRFDEDPLRMLRAIRFASQLDFKISPQTMESLRQQAHQLSTISQERIMSEVSKMLMTSTPGAAIAALVYVGLMPYIVPEFMDIVDMPINRGHKDVYDHTLKVIDQSPPRPMLRWAAWLHDIGKPATYDRSSGDVHFLGHDVVGGKMAQKILRRLKMDVASIEYISDLVTMHMRVNGYTSDWTDGAVRRFIVEAGDKLEDLLDLSDADVTTKNMKLRNEYKRLTAELRSRIIDLQARDNVVQMKSPLDGNDLMALFNRPAGQWIKEIKQALLDAVLDGVLAEDDKETATKMAKEILG